MQLGKGGRNYIPQLLRTRWLHLEESCCLEEKRLSYCSLWALLKTRTEFATYEYSAHTAQQQPQLKGTRDPFQAIWAAMEK